MKCAICGGPIGQGEPVVMADAGYAHRFRSTCEYEFEQGKVRAHALSQAIN